MESEFDACDEENKLLRQVSGDVVDISEARAAWEKFSLTAEAHDLMLKEQTNALRSAVDAKCVSVLQPFSCSAAPCCAVECSAVQCRAACFAALVVRD